MERRIFCSNVFGGERAGAFVSLLGPGNVTFEADDRELGFNQAGIEVYRGTQAANVGAAVTALIGGGLERFTREFTCGGGNH